MSGLMAFAAQAAKAARTLFAHVRRIRAETRLHRAALECELYRNRYRLVSKTDDDLPIVR